MSVSPIPEGFHTLTLYLSVNNADQFLDFIKRAFGAEELLRMPADDGMIRHAEARIGDSPLMITDACEQMPATPCSLHLYVEDADAAYQRAVEAGGESIQEPTDMFYGDRTAGVKDPFGNSWFMATHIEDVPPEELQKRAKEQEQK